MIYNWTFQDSLTKLIENQNSEEVNIGMLGIGMGLANGEPLDIYSILQNVVLYFESKK